jgi:hypothetical protein
LEFVSGGTNPARINPRTHAFTVRCVKEFIPVCYQPRKSTKREKKKTKEKTSPEFHQIITPDGSMANKFSSPPTGTKRLPVGYKSRLYLCSGIILSADTFNPVAAFFPLPGTVILTAGCTS